MESDPAAALTVTSTTIPVLGINARRLVPPRAKGALN